MPSSVPARTRKRPPFISQATKSIARIAAVLLLVYALAAYVIFLIEHDAQGASITSYGKGLWYALVTVSTVGYGDLYPITPAGRVVGGLVIIISVGFIGFVVSKIGDLAAEHSRRKFLGMDGTEFANHYIVIGWNEISRIVIKEMMAAGFRVAALTNNEQDITEMRSIFPDPKTFFVTFGVPEDESAFDRLNIDDAAGAILLAGEDTATLITALELKRINPALKVTAYIKNGRLKKTVENAGVSYVVSPNEIVGRMIASAAFEPDVSNFLEDILSTTTGDDDLDIQEYRLTSGHALVGLTLSEATIELEQHTGGRILSFSRNSGNEWNIFNTSEPGDALRADDYLIILANHSAAQQCGQYLGVQQGRRS